MSTSLDYLKATGTTVVSDSGECAGLRGVEWSGVVWCGVALWRGVVVWWRSVVAG